MTLLIVVFKTGGQVSVTVVSAYFTDIISVSPYVKVSIGTESWQTSTKKGTAPSNTINWNSGHSFSNDYSGSVR